MLATFNLNTSKWHGHFIAPTTNEEGNFPAEKSQGKGTKVQKLGIDCFWHVPKKAETALKQSASSAGFCSSVPRRCNIERKRKSSKTTCKFELNPFDSIVGN